MNNIPVFVTEHGAASLVLKQIPSKGYAFISFGASEEPYALLEDCAAFCRSCGAERIFASGFPDLEERYPLYTKVIVMQTLRENLAGGTAQLWPLLPENSDRWRRIYNERMAKVEHAAYLDFFDMKQQLRDGDCYFIHRGDAILGIGKASKGIIHTLAAVEPGAGEMVVRTLATLIMEETVQLEVASTNQRAIGLYTRLGFLPIRESECWYEII